MSPNFWCQPYVAGNDDLWMRVGYKDSRMYDFRLGSAGVIGELRDGQGHKLIMEPAYPGNVTDRVIQETFFSTKLINPRPTAELSAKFGGNQAPMQNVNQAGSDRNVLTPMGGVSVETSKCIIDVFSIPQLEWHYENEELWQARYIQLSHYQVFGDGVLEVRNIVYPFSLVTNAAMADGVSVSGPQKQFPDFLMSTWIPLDARYDSLAYHATTTNAAADWNYVANSPVSARFDTDKTHGYRVAYNSSNRSGLAVITGKKAPLCVHATGTSDCKAEGAGYSIVHITGTESGNRPNLILANDLQISKPMPMETVIDKTYYLFPFTDFSGGRVSQIQKLADELPQPVVYFPDSNIFNADVDYMNQLRLVKKNGASYSSDHIAHIVHWQ